MKTRKELYNEIVKNNLQEEVKKRFGRNYTQIGNENLEIVIKECTTKDTSKKPKDKPIQIVKTKTTKEKSEYIKSHTSKVDRLIKVLADKRILLKSEVEFIYKED